MDLPEDLRLRVMLLDAKLANEPSALTRAVRRLQEENERLQQENKQLKNSLDFQQRDINALQLDVKDIRKRMR